ncbi:SubName: Full=Uncharacterized protein {ECO:0000313/EMBL:CCA76550.1} [Serendipita indica DSM 11827]|uniref:Uncharacterized protein n=1 Tax=Serendipita indica (strain DSM 11827) TaxID=1109443 RepID=G4TZ07_SERID|nr:SubName: Full=Uncharacterized protein {ECO:0000313/EMBL:CCA76550.1} [Serendipita indica DSM 11827]CCA76550.1 hypothetical protein PIIN_10543 [Serendipita indica DSM 11827]
MSAALSVNDFNTLSGSFVNDGGAWNFRRSDGDVNAGTSSIKWCSDVGRCLSIWVYPSASQPSYSVQVVANVSVPMDQYGNANAVDFNWGYSVEWASSKTARGTSLTSTSQVGSAQFSNSFAADDYEELLHTRQTWINSPFSHRGTTIVTKYGGTTGYFSVQIGLTFPRESGAYINYYIKGASLQITSPIQVVNPPTSETSTSTQSSSTSSSSSSSSTSSSSSSSTSHSQISALPSLSSSTSTPVPSSSSDASISSTQHPETKNASTPAIVGGVVGAVALLAIIVFLVLFYRRKQKQSQIQLPTSEMDDRSFAVAPWMTPNSESNLLAFQPNPTPNNNEPFAIPPHPNNMPLGYGNGFGVPPHAQQLQRTPEGVDDSNAQSPRSSYSHWANPMYAGNNAAFSPMTLRTDIPPPAYIAPSQVFRTPRSAGSNTRPLPAPSIAESVPTSDSIPLSTVGSSGFVAGDAGLSQWARENRHYITEKLEMKLDAAGYVPTDDPDNISEEEWKREWGVTKLELTRMRGLYARSRI